MNRRTVVAVVSMVAIVGTACADDIAVNGGFELGNGGDSDSWSEFAGGAAGTNSARSMDAPISGLWSHVLLAVGDNTTGGASGINQNSIGDGGLLSLQENTTLSFSFDAQTDFGPGGVGFLVLRILNGDGAIVADTGLQPLFTGSNQSPLLNVPAFGGGANDTYAAFAEIVVNAGAFDGSYASAKLDNVVINGTIVPAAGPLALLAIGSLGLARRRR